MCVRARTSVDNEIINTGNLLRSHDRDPRCAAAVGHRDPHAESAVVSYNSIVCNSRT